MAEDKMALLEVLRRRGARKLSGRSSACARITLVVLEIHQLITASQLVVIPCSGHVTPLEQPAACNVAIRARARCAPGGPCWQVIWSCRVLACGSRGSELECQVEWPAEASLGGPARDSAPRN
jgi:hypothetical protein